MKRHYTIVVLIMLTFFVISFLTNVIGPLVPDIIRDFNLSLTMVALLPFAFFIAYGVMSIPSGILIEKYREKKVMIAAFLVSFFGALLLALWPNYINAILSLFLIGSGMAMLQVVINPLLRTAGGDEHFAFNSVLAQLIFGSASFLSPLVYSWLVRNLENRGTNKNILQSLVPDTIPWISLYWLFALISLVMVVVIALIRFPAVELKQDEKAGAIHTHMQLLKKRMVVLYFIGMICYVGSEQGTANWISQFLFTYHGFDPQTTGANTVAYFWGLMTAGGVVGLLLLKLVDSRRILIVFTFLAMVSLAMALFGSGSLALWAFPAVGFFASVMYPIIISLGLNSMTSHHGSFSGIILTGIIGGAIVPLIIGWLGDQAGLRNGMLFLFLTLSYILMIGFWARPIVANKTIFEKKNIT